MGFNPSKCEAITFTKITKPVKAEYRLQDVNLSAVTSAKYLRVHLSSKLLEHTSILWMCGIKKWLTII